MWVRQIQNLAGLLLEYEFKASKLEMKDTYKNFDSGLRDVTVKTNE